MSRPFNLENNPPMTTTIASSNPNPISSQISRDFLIRPLGFLQQPNSSFVTTPGPLLVFHRICFKLQSLLFSFHQAMCVKAQIQGLYRNTSFSTFRRNTSSNLESFKIKKTCNFLHQFFRREFSIKCNFE